MAPSATSAHRSAQELRVLLDEAIAKARWSEGRINVLDEALREALISLDHLVSRARRGAPWESELKLYTSTVARLRLVQEGRHG